MNSPYQRAKAAGHLEAYARAAYDQPETRMGQAVRTMSEMAHPMTLTYKGVTPFEAAIAAAHDSYPGLVPHLEKAHVISHMPMMMEETRRTANAYRHLRQTAGAAEANKALLPLGLNYGVNAFKAVRPIVVNRAVNYGRRWLEKRFAEPPQTQPIVHTARPFMDRLVRKARPLMRHPALMPSALLATGVGVGMVASSLINRNALPAPGVSNA